MKRLAILFLVASSRAICNPTPPAQVPEAPANVAGEAASSASASADADIGVNGGAPPPPAPPTESFQAVSATLGGSTWELKGAGTAGPVKVGDNTVVITLANYNIECMAHTPGPGDRVITVTIPWEKGAKVDVATLKAKEIVATAFDEKTKKPAPLKAWKPTGTIEVVAAPTKGKSSGRIRIDLANKLDVIKAEIPVRFCFPS